MKKVSKDYTYRVQMDSPVKSAVLEKKLVDFGVSSIVSESKGEYAVALSYPIPGKDLLARLCEGTTNLIKVYDASGEVYSNHPIEAAAVEESIEELPPVIEIKKPVPVTESSKELSEKLAALVTETLSRDLENIIGKLLENRAPAAEQFDHQITVDAVSNINGSIEQLKESIAQLTSSVSAINSVVNDAMGSYSRKLVELTEANNKLNHKVKKTIVRDANGFITEVTEQIIPEK